MDPAAHNRPEAGADGATNDALGAFGLETPSDGPAPTPSYTNFSPLFSSANAAILNGPPPVAPIALRANASQATPDPTFFPGFLDNGQNGNGFLMDANVASDAVFSYASLHTPPVPIPCKPHSGMKRRRLDDFDVGRSGDRPVDNVGYTGHAPLDSYYSGGLPLAADSQPDPSFYYHAQLPPPPAPRAPARPAPEPPLSPESAMDAALKKSSGSSCHQCKNRRESRHLNFCRNRTRGASDDKKKKICRKKFCDHCIVKFNYQVHLPAKNSRDWECPSCLGICVCAACRRKNEPAAPAYAGGGGAEARLSPTLSFAHKLFYNPELIGQAQEPPAPVIDSMPFFNSAF